MNDNATWVPTQGLMLGSPWVSLAILSILFFAYAFMLARKDSGKTRKTVITLLAVLGLCVMCLSAWFAYTAN